MRAHLLLPVLLLALPVLAHAADDDWKPFNSDKLNFGVSLPKAPEESNQTIDGVGGKIDIHFFQVELSDDSGYQVVVADLNDKDTRSNETVLDEARDGAVAAVDAKLTGEKKITVEGNPAREYQATAEKYHVIAHIFVIKRRLFQLMSIAPTGKSLPANTDKFLSSFHSLKK